eukprot:6191924-Pleurochrysis_carterae.AAC.2
MPHLPAVLTRGLAICCRMQFYLNPSTCVRLCLQHGLGYQIMSTAKANGKVHAQFERGLGYVLIAH